MRRGSAPRHAAPAHQSTNSESRVTFGGYCRRTIRGVTFSPVWLLGNLSYLVLGLWRIAAGERRGLPQFIAILFSLQITALLWWLFGPVGLIALAPMTIAFAIGAEKDLRKKIRGAAAREE